jgi:uncharacterized protein YqkB
MPRTGEEVVQRARFVDLPPGSRFRFEGESTSCWKCGVTRYRVAPAIGSREKAIDPYTVVIFEGKRGT